MVATGSVESNGWLQAAPNTPTTPVDKPANWSTKQNNNKKNDHNLPVKILPTAAAPTPKRPDFHPPILLAPQRTPSVQFDLNGSQNSAFTAVGPRPSTAATDSAVVEPAGLLLPTLQQPYTTTAADNARKAHSKVPLESPGRRHGRYTGPVDVDEVSLTSTLSSVEEIVSLSSTEEPDGSGKSQHAHGPGNFLDGSLQEDTWQFIQSEAFSEEQASPKSPATPLIKNTRNWLVNQKEPFLRSGMLPLSPPISTRHFMHSGMTLPDSQVGPSPLPNSNSVEGSTKDSDSAPLSPPLSPLHLAESLIGLLQRDSSKSPEATSDVNLRLDDPRSPPLSPFDIETVDFRRPGKQMMKSPISPPLSTLKLHCSALMESAFSLPPALKPDDSKPMEKKAPAADDHSELMSPSVEKRTKKTSRQVRDGGSRDCIPELLEICEATPISPTSPPIVSRYPVGSSDWLPDFNWLEDGKEPFLLQQVMEEDRVSPPLSSSNLMARTSIGSGKHTLLMVSPPTSPPSTLELTRSLLQELDQAQTPAPKARSKKRRERSNRKKEIYQQLHHAQQVVRVVLRGSKYANLDDVQSPQACYDAIRHYAQLKVERSNLATQLEDWKERLKERYLEWKDLRKEMQQKPAEKSSEENAIATRKTQDSMALLQQLLSDDESIYKEDDAVELEPDSVLDLPTNESFSVSVNEMDSGKAMERLFQEMQNELEMIRSAWHEHRSRKPDTAEMRDEHHTTLTFDKLDDATKDIDPHPLQRNDSFLLTKIEELTAKIESMEKDQVVTVGNMEQLLAEQVAKAEPAEALPPTPSSEIPIGLLPETWTTFGSKFPIYRVRETEEEDGGADEGTNDNEKSGKPQAPIDVQVYTIKSHGAYANIFRPPSLLLRSRRFHRSSDSDSDHDMLPIHMAQSRGVSFEGGEPQVLQKEEKRQLDVPAWEHHAVTELQNKLAKSEKEIEEMKARYAKTAASLLDMQNRGSKSNEGGAIELRLLEKAEQCDRLSSQVKALTGQLEKHMVRVSELEIQVAAHNSADKARDQGHVEQLLMEWDYSSHQTEAPQLTQAQGSSAWL